MGYNQSSFDKDRNLNITLGLNSFEDNSSNPYPLLYNIYELVNDSVLVFNLSKKIIVHVNSQFSNTFVYTKYEVVGKASCFSNLFLNKNDASKIYALLEQYKVLKDYEVVLKTKDNHKLNALLSAQMYQEGDNNFVVFVIKDILEKKSIETVLRTHHEQLNKVVNEKTAEIKKSEKRFRDLYDNALVALLTTHIDDGMPIETNNAAVNLFGYNSITEFKENFTKRHHFIEPSRETFFEKLESSSYIEKLHLCCIRKDGEKIWVDAELKLNRETSIINWVLVDVSDKHIQRTQNRRLLKAVNESPESIVITDSEGAIEYVNKQFCEVTGYSEEELIGNNPRALTSGVHDKEFYTDLWSTIKSGKIWKGEMYNKRKDGTFFWEHASIAPIYEGGEITHFVAIKEDITAKKQMVSELLIAKEKAEESDRLKTAFLTNISHEIRTPMNGILGFTGLLKDNGLSGAEQREYIEMIEKSGERMLNTIHDIIDMSRIESGEVNFNFSKINLTEQLKHFYNTFYDEAVEKGIKLSCQNMVQEKELIINSDKAKLNFIITSLLKNALKYTNEGRIDFGCSIENENNQNFLKFYVKDTGIGVPKDKHEKIFKRFVQADSRTNRSYDGSGLGLSIAKSYAEMLEGHIYLESEEGKGSTFNVIIPLERNGENINQMDVIFSTINEDVKLKGLKILVVDDEALVRKYFGIILNDIKKEILYAKTGKEAVEKFSENPDIDLILMDVRMPEMNGFEATKRIREQNKDVQIIIQSAFVELDENQEAVKAGANYFISKPVNKKKLMGIIDEIFITKNSKIKHLPKFQN